MTTVDGGRAVVNVVTKASATSLAATGKLIEKKLEESAKRSGNIFARQFDISLGRGAVLFGAFNSLAAPVASTISQLGAGVVALGASLQQTSIAATAFTGIFGSLIQTVSVANLAFDGFGKAVGAATPELFEKALKKIPPAAQEAARGMRAFREELQQKVSTAAFDGLTESFRAVGKNLVPVLNARLTETGTVLNGFLKDLSKFAATESFVTRLNTVLGSNNTIFKTLSEAAIPFLDALLNIFVALAPSAERLAVSIGKVAERFKEWTEEAGFAERVDGIMQRAQKTAGLLLRTVGNLAQALGAVFTAAAPAGNQFLTMLNDVFIRFEAFAKSADGKAQIAAWAETGVQAMGRLGETLRDLGPVFAALADPAVFNSLLKVLDSWAKTMAVLAPLLTTTAKALGFFAPIVGPALALSGVFFSFTLQAKILKGVLGSLGLGNLARGFLDSQAAASSATGVMGTAGGKIARAFDGIRLQTKALGGPGLFAAAKAQFAAFGTFVAGALTKVSTALRVAFATNPVGVIITGLILLGTALFVLYKKSETFRNAVNAVWGAIKVAAAATVDWFTGTALPALQSVWDGIVAGATAVGGFFATIWDGLVVGFTAVWTALMAVWTAVGVPIFNVIKFFIMVWVKALQVAWTLIQIAFALVWFGLKAVWNNVAVPLFNLIKAYIDLWVAGIALVWGLIKIAWDAVWNALQAVWEAVGVPLLEAIQAGWNKFVSVLTKVWNKLKAAWDVVLGKIKAAWGTVWGAIVRVWETVGRPIFDKIMAVWEKLKSAASKITTAIGDFFSGMWDGVVDTAKSAINGLIRLMNGIISGVNALATATNTLTGSSIAAIQPIPELATGVRNFRGGVALVGEQGPELVSMPRGSNVYSNRETQDMVGKNEITVIQNFLGPQTSIAQVRAADFAYRFPTQAGGRRG